MVGKTNLRDFKLVYCHNVKSYVHANSTVNKKYSAQPTLLATLSVTLNPIEWEGLPFLPLSVAVCFWRWEAPVGSVHSAVPSECAASRCVPALSSSRSLLHACPATLPTRPHTRRRCRSHRNAAPAQQTDGFCRCSLPVDSLLTAAHHCPATTIIHSAHRCSC